MSDATTAAPTDGVVGWITDVIAEAGELGVGILILLENVLPPLPSEAVLGFAGFGIAEGELVAVTTWAAATAGSLLGAYLLYAVGALVGRDRLYELAGKRWFVLCNQADLRRGDRFFTRHGGKVVLVGRVVPLIRSVVSVPAGAARMPLGRFTALTTVGAGVWNAALLYAGFRLGAQWHRVEALVGPLSYVVAALGLAAVLWLTARTLRRRARERRALPGAGAAGS